MDPHRIWTPWLISKGVRSVYSMRHRKWTPIHSIFYGGSIFYDSIMDSTRVGPYSIGNMASGSIFHGVHKDSIFYMTLAIQISISIMLIMD